MDKYGAEDSNSSTRQPSLRPSGSRDLTLLSSTSSHATRLAFTARTSRSLLSVKKKEVESIGNKETMEVERSKRMRIDVDKLPMKRLHAIDEIGNEQFPPDKSNEEQRLSAIHRIDFSSLVEMEMDKDKEEAEKKGKDGQQQQQTWQGLMENLQTAQHELSVVLDLINTVEANDAVAVAGMQRPKLLPNEALADFAVSAATKVQRLRHLGRYFKQCSKQMGQQVSKEARFYDSLIRLQQSWKVKRQRIGLNEGLIFDLFDSSFLSVADPISRSRLAQMATISINRDVSGMLAIQLPQRLCRTLSLKFLGDDDSSTFRIKSNISEKKASSSESGMGRQSVTKESLSDEDDVNSSIKTTHSVLRDIHRSMFEEKVFEMVNQEAYSSQSSHGINVTGMQQDLLQLVIGQDNSLCLSLVLSESERGKKEKVKDDSYNDDNSESFPSSALAPISLPMDDKNSPYRNSSRVTISSNPVRALEIYLLSIFHKEALLRAKGERSSDGSLLTHFCMTAAHRVFSKKVLSILENLVSKVPYVELVTLPTWHSRTSSWNLRLKVPEASSALDGGYQKQTRRPLFLTKVVINDGQLSLRGQSSATIVASFTGDAMKPHSVNTYSCDLEDFPMLILHQMASQVIRWLHEEALLMGMKTSRDLLCLHMNLEQGDTISLLAHIDPDDASACISWVLMLPSAADDDVNFSLNQSDSENPRLRSLGSLSLESLYSVITDIANLCVNSTIF